MNSCYRKGARAERKVQAILEAAGYITARAAGSHGYADVIAWDSVAVRFVSVKCGNAYASRIEREQLAMMPKPANATAEIWRLQDRKPPLIEVL